MFAVIHIPNFGLQAVLRHEPELATRPVALIDGNEKQAVILQLTETARRSGACEGLTAPQAMARCADIVIKSRSLAQEQAVGEILLQCAYDFSPRIEATADGVCTLDLQGLPLEFRSCRREEADHVCQDREPSESPRGLGVRWLAGNGADTAFAHGSSSESKAVCALTPHPPHSKTQAREAQDWAIQVVAALAQFNLAAQVGIAQTPNVAFYAARYAAPVLVVEDAEEFVASLPVEILAPSPEVFGILRRWGIRTVGAFVALGKDRVVERLGLDALSLFHRASVREIRPLKLVTPPETFSESMDFSSEIETLEPLLFVLNRFVGQLAARLDLLGLVVAGLDLRLKLASGKFYERLFQVPAPTSRAETLFRMLQTHLENVRTDSPIVSLQLAARPSDSRAHQFSLFEARLRNPNQFHHTLARLSALCGTGNVGTPIVEDSFRPDAFRMESPRFESATVAAVYDRRSSSETAAVADTPLQGLHLRRFRPPFHADVEMENGRPTFISSLKLNGPVERVSGPWRSSGHWWEREKLWNRDAWDIQTRDGALYRICCEQEDWLVEGVYD
jgi:protein ImuB